MTSLNCKKMLKIKSLYHICYVGIIHCLLFTKLRYLLDFRTLIVISFEIRYTAPAIAQNCPIPPHNNLNVKRMKLHLPKALTAAMMLTFIAVSVQAETNTESSDYTEHEPEELKNIELTIPTPDDNDNYHYNIGAQTGTAPDTVTIQQLTLNNKDTLGIYSGDTHNETALITSNFGKTENGTHTGNDYTNTLAVTDSLTLNDFSIIALGGRYKKDGILGFLGSKDQYIGITAGAVSVNDSAKLIAGSANFASLSANGASTVKIHHDNGSGTDYRGGNTIGNSYDKQTKISGAISVTQGAKVTIGVDNGQNGDNSYNEQFLNHLGGTISQDSAKVVDQETGATLSEKSVLAIKGRTYISGNLNITQSGGDMEIALWHRNPAAGSSGNVPSILRLAKANNNTITQTTGGSMKIGQIACGKNGNSNSQIAIEQQGSGTIELVNGVAFTTKDAASASTIKQTSTVDNGAIKLTGDFTSATFNIEQEGKGSIELNGSMKSHSVSVGGDMEVKGSLAAAAEDSLLTIVGQGHLKNGGSVDMDILLEGGELTAVDGSIFAHVVATSGTIYLGDKVSFSSLTLGSNAEVALYTLRNTQNGVTVYVGKGGAVANDVMIGNNVTFVVETESTADELVGQNLTIFKKQDGTTYNLNEAKLIVKDSAGTETELTFSSNGDGTVNVTGNIPEPTTATLSLLALAALAARRRRN